MSDNFSIKYYLLIPFAKYFFNSIITYIFANKIISMEDNKYYTPDLEDIRIGYSCEIKSNDNWDFYVVGEGYENITINRAINETKFGGIRTPYLTKEDIESEKWKWDRTYSCYMKNDVKLWLEDNQKLSLMVEHDYLFNGECKSINEFKYITEKLLKIK